MAPFHNLLEPEALIRHFRQNPPEGFTIPDVPIPAFSTRYDLLTTVDSAILNRLARIPMFNRLRSSLRRDTCFLGTTVSEYALFPSAMGPGEVSSQIAEMTPHSPLVIVKDLPTEATLVGECALTISDAIARACREAGFVLVEGQALAYVPIDFSSIEEYLGRRSDARRKNLRRKLRSRSSLHIEAILTGDERFRDIPFLDRLYALYLNVFQQSDVHFDLLTPSFFRAVLQDDSMEGILFTYRSGQELIGYNLCFVHDGRLIDKYVGFVYPAAREHNLYAVSWFHNLEYALSRNLTHYVAGWTDPEVKRSLGARFTFTQHAVHVRNRVARRLLQPFRRWFESDAQWRN